MLKIKRWIPSHDAAKADVVTAAKEPEPPPEEVPAAPSRRYTMADYDEMIARITNLVGTHSAPVQ